MLKKYFYTMGIVSLFLSYTPATFATDEKILSFELEPFNVTASGYEKTNLETPADITVYTGEDLKNTGAKDVANALKYKAGVQFTQMGPHDQSWITGNSSVNLRGIKGGTLILLNGIPANFNGVSHLDMISLDLVKKVEVVKGGGAVLYGSEAYGGVINIITEDNYDNTLSLAFGNKGHKEYSATIGTGKFGMYLGLQEHGDTGIMTDVMGTKTFDGEKVPYYVSFGDSKKYSMGMNYKFNDNWSVNYHFNKKKYTMDYSDADNNTLQHFMYDDREHFTQVHFNDQHGFNALAYYNERSIKNPDYWTGNENVVEWERSKHKNYGINVNQVWENTNDKILLGFSSKRELYVNENQKFKSFGNSNSTLKPYAHFGTYDLDEYSLYGQYDRKLSAATDLIFSVREDLVRADNGNYDAFLPQLQVITKLNEVNSLYANIGRSFKMPTFRQLYYSSGILLDNPDLKPEYGWNYEAGYKYDNGNEQFKAAVFHIDLDDQITTRKVKVNGSTMTQPYNAAKYRNTGVELSYSKSLDDKFSWSVGGIYSNPQNKASEDAPWKDVLGKYQVMTALEYHHEKTAAALNLSYMGGRVNNSKNVDVSPLLLSNLHISHEVLDNAVVTLDVNNIFNRRDLSDPDGLYYTQGRTFVVGMNYTF